MKVCRVCLAMSVKLYHMWEHKLSVMYERVTGVKINSEDKLPKMICWECVARLSSANNFLEKALKTRWILLNTITGDNITMNDIASIDRAQHRLESSLGFKHYEVINTDLHIQRESGVHNASNVELSINKYEDNEFKDVEIITIKSEILEITEQSEETAIQVQNPIVIIKKHESDEEITIDAVSNASEAPGDEDLAVHKEVCETIKQELKDFTVTSLSYRTNGLPFNKELKVVLDDVMSPIGKQNTQESFGEVTNNDVSYRKAQSVKIKETITHPTISKGTLTKSNFMDTDSASTIQAAKFINPALNNLHDFPKNVNKKVCARTVTVNSNINFTHYDAESTKNIFICDICNKSYQKKTSLYEHIRRHLNLFNCSYCSYTGHNKGDLKKHINTKHTKNTVYNCSYCSYETCDKSNLSSHVNSKHTKNTVYNCSYCSYETCDRSNLSKHINNKHTKNTVYNCSYCSYSTYNRNNLRFHVNCKHTENTVYNCSYCSYETYDRSSFSYHMNSKHTKKTVYNCSYCDYKTFRQLDLNGHINSIHTKVNVFNCSYCNYKTYAKNTLARHINSKHTKNTVLKCGHCSYETHYKNNLGRHIKAKHNN